MQGGTVNVHEITASLRRYQPDQVQWVFLNLVKGTPANKYYKAAAGLFPKAAQR